MEFELGRTYSGYKFLDVVGRSRNLVEYRVQNTIAQRLENLRTLPAASTDDREAAERFLREVRIRARLQHPHVVSFYTALPVEGRMVMTTELYDGLPLAERLLLGPLPWREAVRVACQILEVLTCLHQQSFVHCDITPENIQFGPEGFCKLSSFAMTRPLGEAHAPESGAVAGNPKYISPEQVKGVGELDRRSDLYSLGVVLYEMLCGRPPFESRSQFELMLAHVNQAPVPPSEVNRAVPKFLDAVVLRGLAKDPAGRYATALDFSAALAAAESAPVVGEAPVVETTHPVVEVVAAAEVEAVAVAETAAAVVEVIAEPVVETVAIEEVAEPVVEVIAEPVVEAVAIEEVAEPAVEVIAEPVVEAVAIEEVAEPAVEVIGEPVVDVVVIEEVAEPAVEVIAEPVVDVVAIEQVAEPVVEIIAAPKVEAVAIVDVAEPVVEIIAKPVVEAVAVVETAEPVVEVIVAPEVEAVPIVEVAEPVVEIIAAPVVEAVAAAEPVVEIIAAPVVQAVAIEEFAEPVVEVMTAPVVQAVAIEEPAAPVVEVMTAPIVQPVAIEEPKEPVAQAVAEPVVAGRSAEGHSQPSRDREGAFAIHARQTLPDGRGSDGVAAADSLDNTLWAAAAMVAASALAASPTAQAEHTVPVAKPAPAAPIAIPVAPVPVPAAAPAPAPVPTPVPVPMSIVRPQPDSIQWFVFGGTAAFLGVIWVAIWLVAGK